MRHNDIKFSLLTVNLLASTTRDSTHAFANYFDGKNSVMVREDGFLMLQAAGRCNGKEFEILAGRSLENGQTEVYLFSKENLTEKEKVCISSKARRTMLRRNLNIDESTRGKLNHLHINQSLIELHKRYNALEDIPAAIKHPELFYFLNVSAVNMKHAVHLGAVLNTQIKRYSISSLHQNFRHPDLLQWRPENNPMFKLDNPNSIMRLNQLFMDNGATLVRNISNYGKVSSTNWVIFADHPNFDDMRIYILGNQFRTYLNVSKHDISLVRDLGAIWDKRCGKFYTVDNENNHIRFNKWLPENNPELLVYITASHFKDVKAMDLHSFERNLYRRTYTDNPYLKEILQCQQLSILERETLKKELILLHVGKDDVETVRKLGAVQQRVLLRHEWFVSTDHPNYKELQQWLPERNPKHFITDLSIEQCKALGGFYDVIKKQWFIYEKNYSSKLQKSA